MVQPRPIAPGKREPSQQRQHAVQVGSGDLYALLLDTALQLLWIAQEALSNTLKYADARRLTIELVFEPQQSQLCVQDYRRGFDPTLAAAAGSFGLLSLRVRAAVFGAELTMHSATR